MTRPTIIVDQSAKKSELYDGSFKLMCRRGCIVHGQRRESPETNSIVGYRSCKQVIGFPGQVIGGGFVGNALILRCELRQHI